MVPAYAVRFVLPTSTTRSADDVLARLADLRNATAWTPSIVENVELVAGEPGEVGARFLVTNQRAIVERD